MNKQSDDEQRNDDEQNNDDEQRAIANSFISSLKSTQDSRQIELIKNVLISISFFLPVLSASPPQKGAPSIVTIGRIACSLPISSWVKPHDDMNSDMNGMRLPVENRKKK